MTGPGHLSARRLRPTLNSSRCPERAFPRSCCPGFRWSLDFTTYAGLVNQAAGAWPAQVEEQDFLERLKTRDTFPFLKELFDTQVLIADARPAPLTLAEMTNRDGLIPVAFRGNVVKVDVMTSQPVGDAVAAEPFAGGLRLRNLQAVRIRGPIGQRSRTPFQLPVYRISP
jgi:hypothetical protein